jgi:hypothetical protein
VLIFSSKLLVADPQVFSAIVNPVLIIAKQVVSCRQGFDVFVIFEAMGLTLVEALASPAVTAPSFIRAV